MDQLSLSFLRTMRTHLQELESVTAGHSDAPLQARHVEAALEAARRALTAIERFVQYRSVSSEGSQGA